jgi:hypothetical protein
VARCPQHEQDLHPLRRGYDEVGQLLILLHVGAAAVWERCDGTATFGDITADLGRAHTGDPPPSPRMRG